MSTILLSGSLAYDRIMVFPGLFKDHFLPDKLHNINVSFYVPKHEEHFGGTAGNIAYNLSLLDEKASPITTVGADFVKYRAHLNALHVDTSLVQIENAEQTAFAYILTDKADNQISAFCPGAMSIPYTTDIRYEPETMAVISAGCLEDIKKFPSVFREKNVPFLFDPGQSITALDAESIKNGIQGAEVVFANDYEFHLMAEKTGWSEADVASVAQVLVITLGAEGSRVITKDKEERVSVVPTIGVKDPTGAGDAYRAGYIKAMLMGKDPTTCAKLGSAVAVYAVEVVGTQEHSFTPEELEKRYAAVYGDAISLS